MKNKLLMGVMFLSIIMVTVRCKKNSSIPTIPEQTSYLLDFSYFQDLDERTVVQDPQKNNWKFALHNLGIWEVIKNVTLKVPLTALNKAHTITPVYNQKNGWTWNMKFSESGVVYKSRLTAQTSGKTTEWKLYITDVNSFDEFLWLSGSSSQNNTNGTWNFKLNPGNPKAYLTIDWKKSNNSFDLKYQNILDGSAEKNSFISFKNVEGSEYQNSFLVFDQSKNNAVKIRWNQQSKEGQIKDPHHFSDTQFHCWDGTRNDLNCNFNENLSINNSHPHHKNKSMVR